MKKLLNVALLIPVSFSVLTNLAVSQDNSVKDKVIPIGQNKPTEDKLPKPLSYPEPIYPDEVTNADLTGQVRLHIKVDKQGKVSVFDSFGPNAPCSNLGDPKAKEIRKAVIAATEKAIFEIPMVDGQPTEKSLIIKFDLKPKTKSPADENKKLVQGGVVNGKALRLPKPEYPIGARYTRAAGAVQVQVLIGEDGKVISAGAVSGDSLLRETSVKTACKALFSPTLLAGQPVKVSGIITYYYVP
jgi:outer membrane biosynthesis protein TonB